MNLTPKQQRAAAMGIVGLVGWFSGVFMPPELVAEILGAFA